MNALFNEWRVLVLVCIVAFGLWGFLAKLSAAHLTWTQLTFMILVTNATLVIAVTARGLAGLEARWALVAALAGVCAAAGSLSLYRALSLAPANVVIPLSSFYVVVTVVLSSVFLQEPVTARQLLGMLLGLAAIVLLTGSSARTLSS